MFFAQVDGGFVANTTLLRIDLLVQLFGGASFMKRVIPDQFAQITLVCLTHVPVLFESAIRSSFRLVAQPDSPVTFHSVW